jgi:hypothetical protein
MAHFERAAHVATPRRLATLVIALVLFAAACSGDDAATSSPAASPDRSASSSTTTTAPATPSTSTASQSVEEQIVARYLGFWDARLSANNGSPDPDAPALREFATGAQLETVIAETRQRLESGLALREAEPSLSEHSVSVVSNSADRAELQDCFVNDGVIYSVGTGDVIDDSVVTRNVTALMVLEQGEWKLERATVIQEWEGVAGCALAG